MLRSPGIYRGRQPTASVLGWVLAGLFGLLFSEFHCACIHLKKLIMLWHKDFRLLPSVYSSMPRGLGNAPTPSLSSVGSTTEGMHRLPRNSGESQLNQTKQHGPGKFPEIRRFFVVGCGHSGTSLLLRTIGNMPLVRCIQRETAIFHKKNVGDAKIETVLAYWDRIARRGNFSAWVEKTPRVSITDGALSQPQSRTTSCSFFLDFMNFCIAACLLHIQDVSTGHIHDV